MIANSLADWFTSYLNIFCLFIFIVLSLWHLYVIIKLYQAHRKLNSLLTHDTHKSAINSYKDRLHKGDWYDYYSTIMKEYEPYLHDHYTILPFYTLTGLLGTVLSIIFSYDLEHQAQLGIALFSTGLGIVFSLGFRWAGNSPARNRERYLSNYRQIEYPQNSSNQEDKQS